MDRPPREDYISRGTPRRADASRHRPGATESAVGRAQPERGGVGPPPRRRRARAAGPGPWVPPSSRPDPRFQPAPLSCGGRCGLRGGAWGWLGSSAARSCASPRAPRRPPPWLRLLAGRAAPRRRPVHCTEQAPAPRPLPAAGAPAAGGRGGPGLNPGRRAAGVPPPQLQGAVSVPLEVPQAPPGPLRHPGEVAPDHISALSMSCSCIAFAPVLARLPSWSRG